jgi:anti-anti-sigma regulatory factor
MSDLKQQAVCWQAANERTIYHIVNLQAELLDLMSLEKKLTLDLSKVEQFDVSFIQLLLAVWAYAKNNNIQLKIEGASDELTDVINSIYCKPALKGFSRTGRQENNYAC